MNSPQQINAVTDIIRIKNKILHSSDWDEIARLMQEAIDVSSPVPANDYIYTLDRTMTKEWNVISIKNLMKTVKAKGFADLDVAYPVVAASLLRLAMIFVKGGLADINKILAASLSRKGLFQVSENKTSKERIK